jgi:hypothetical protein
MFERILFVIIISILMLGSLPSGTPGIDGPTHVTTTIEYEHHEVHSGRMYHVTRVVQLDDANSDEILIETPNTTRWGHFTPSVQGSFDTEWWLFETTTKTTGTAMTEHNHDRNSSNVAGIVVTHTPGAGADGNEIDHRRFGNDAGPAGKGGSGSDTRANNEWILKQNTKYLLRVTSHTDTNNISIVLDWYEHRNK